jgi:DNA-binding YbaB/EbfC family protein
MAKNMAQALKQMQKVQAELARVQEELERKTVEGSSGGGMVTVVANGKQEIVKIEIDPEVVDPHEVELLEDLILAAVSQARERAQELAEQEMSRVAGSFLPQMGANFKIPGLGL